MAEMTEDEIIATIRAIDDKIGLIIADGASNVGLGDFSPNQPSSLGALRETRAMYQEALDHVQGPGFQRTSVDMADA
jgi:hypothetical protein